MKKYKVLIVDDSPLMRELLTSIIDSAPDLEVVGTAPNPLIARQKIKELLPDVVTLDIEMPEMDGISFLEKIMRLRPMPVVMISSLTQEGADETLRALEIGAVDVIGKPGSASGAITEKRHEIIKKVSAAVTAKVVPYAGVKAMQIPKKVTAHYVGNKYDLLAIGASTGGISAIREFLEELSPNCPPIVITQHMPAEYTKNFASRLNALLPFIISEAKEGEKLLPGHVYIAPGSQHLKVIKKASGLYSELNDGDLVSGHKPSVDVLFSSVAANFTDRAIGVILTGMGRDGAAGLLEMRKAGAVTFGQNEESCVVYGMPKVAMNVGAVIQELSLKNIAKTINSYLKN